jgi:hypothetical protein
MDIRRKVSQVFNNNLQGILLKKKKKNRWWNCVQTDVNKCKITNWKERSRNRADEEFHSGDEGPHWTVVQSKKKTKKKKKKRRRRKKKKKRRRRR